MTLDLVALANGVKLPASKIEVIEQIGEPATFRMHAALAWQDGDFPILRAATTAPNAMVTIGTTVTVPHVLCHGPIYAHATHYAHGSGGTVEVAGGDECFVLDREIVGKVWPDGKVSDSIGHLLQQRGFQPTVDPIEAPYVEKDHALVQHDSDLRFLRRMARRYGRWFWLRRDPVTNQTAAYFVKPSQPPPKPPIAITINVPNNVVDELDLEWDIVRPTAALAGQIGGRDKAPIDAALDRSGAPALAKLPLRDIAGVRHVRVTAPVDSLADLQARADAALGDAGWFVRVRGTTTVKRLGAVLRAHEHVTLHGVGSRHAGTYVVSRVHHVSTDDAHAMSFELVRNAWEA
jgi:hypothetical protein